MSAAARLFLVARPNDPTAWRVQTALHTRPRHTGNFKGPLAQLKSCTRSPSPPLKFAWDEAARTCSECIAAQTKHRKILPGRMTSMTPVYGVLLRWFNRHVASSRVLVISSIVSSELPRILSSLKDSEWSAHVGAHPVIVYGSLSSVGRLTTCLSVLVCLGPGRLAG